MDNASNNGNNSLFLSIILGVFSWFTPERVDIGLKVLTAVGAVTAAIFAIRYHIAATKLKKRELEEFERNRRG